MNKAKPKGEVFEGRSGEMSDSPWLASEDLLGAGDQVVTILRCHKYKDVEFDGGRKESTVFALEFDGKKKQLVLNSTNRKMLVNLFGSNVKDWCDQKVTLWVDENVRFAGKRVRGIRIKK
ncbi:MAG: hypothetical protein ACPHEP_01405 [Acidimicrobiales bacterium]|jgi:hypothetical protein